MVFAPPPIIAVASLPPFPAASALVSVLSVRVTRTTAWALLHPLQSLLQPVVLSHHLLQFRLQSPQFLSQMPKLAVVLCSYPTRRRIVAQLFGRNGRPLRFVIGRQILPSDFVVACASRHSRLLVPARLHSLIG